MAPAIVHFLVGAALLLLLATPLALRSVRVRNAGLLLVTVGGLWGLAPDFHHVAPVYRDQLSAFHDSKWADAFGFHYTLDLDPIRELMLVSIFASILLFCVAVTVFTAACWVGERYGDTPVTVGIGTVSGVLVGAFVSTLILGTTIHSGGQIAALGSIVGLQQSVFGWIVTGLCATLAAAGFALLVELGPGSEALSPSWAAGGGLALGVLTWLVAVMTAPVFLLRVFGTPLSLGHVGVETLVGFALAGAAVGLVYTLVARRIDERSDRSLAHSSLSR